MCASDVNIEPGVNTIVNYSSVTVNFPVNNSSVPVNFPVTVPVDFDVNGGVNIASIDNLSEIMIISQVHFLLVMSLLVLMNENYHLTQLKLQKNSFVMITLNLVTMKLWIWVFYQK